MISFIILDASRWSWRT